MRVLITGITGQTGSYLAELYAEKGWEVYGFVRQRSDLVNLTKVDKVVNLRTQDIRDPHGVLSNVREIRPDIIHHLAAMTYVPYSWNNPLDTFETNVLATINVLEAARVVEPTPVVHYAGSSEEYGLVEPKDIPLTEETLVRPGSPYGISKYTSDLLCQQYWKSYSLPTIITRAFNHESPRRGVQFISTQVVLQALAIKAGKQLTFKLGNLDSIRDFSDARDVVEAYFLAVTNRNVKPGTPYNICSEKGYKIREVVNMVKQELELGDVPVMVDPARVRPSDLPVLVGSSRKFRKATEWKPKYSFEDTLRWMIQELGE